MDSLLLKNYQSELMLALEEVLREFEMLPAEVIKDFWNPQKCREDLLPYLALYLGVNSWDSSWNINQKRAVCQSALLVNKQKGTLQSLKDALRALNLNATLVEWWQNGAERGTAEINLHENEIIYSEEQYKVIYKLINEVKRLSLRISLRKRNSIKGNLVVGGAVGLLNNTSIAFTALGSKTLRSEGKHYIGASFNFVHRINI